MFFNQQTSSRRVDHVFIMFSRTVCQKVFGEKSRTMHADLTGGPGLLQFFKITNTLKFS